MRFSYYSDRRFKRGSLAHELCSKIEVTKGKGEKRKRERRSYLHDPGFLSSSPPTVFFLSLASPFSAPRDSFFSSPCAGFVLRLRSYERGGSPCFCFNDIFSPRIGRESSSPRSLYLFRFLSCSLSFLFSIRRFDPVRSVEGNPQNLLEILWIIINAYAVVESIDRPVWSLPFISRPPPSFRPFLSSSSFAAIGGFRYVRSEERRRRRRCRRRRHEIIQSNEARFV